MREEIEKYLQHLKLSNSSKETIRSYRGYLFDFESSLGELHPSAIDVGHIEQYLSRLSERQLARASVARALATVKSFCRWMTDEGLLEENPAEAFQGPRKPHRVTLRATEAEVLRLIEGPIRTSFPTRDRLMLELMYGSGLRCDETASINLCDFAEPDMLLVAHGKGDKQRYVLLTDHAQRALKPYLKKRKEILRNRSKRGDRREIAGLFFALSGAQIGSLSPRSVYRIVVKIATEAGLPWLSPHDLRRAFATHMDEHGAQHIVISKLLGHAKLSITEQYIASGSPQRLKRAYDRARGAFAR